MAEAEAREAQQAAFVVSLLKRIDTERELGAFWQRRAEHEREQRNLRHAAYLGATARAEAAEAALERGVRELQAERFAALERAAAVWERRALAAEAQREAAREDGAHAFLTWLYERSRVYDGFLWRQFAAWQAAQQTETTP